MSEELELKLFQKIEELEREIKSLKGEEVSQIPIYNFSKIRDAELEKLFIIKKNLNRDIFDSWFNNSILIDDEIELFLKNLIFDNEKLIDSYKEEDLKIKFLAPLLNKIKFVSFKDEFRDFYEEKLTYQTENFILTGTADFIVSKGLIKSEKPYFFIQEFKRSEEYGNPRPQLLAELILAVEVNNFEIIKGAYIIGAIWNFVILQRVEKHNYIYYVSANFDSTKIEDLKLIYKNLLFIKDEIICFLQSELK